MTDQTQAASILSHGEQDVAGHLRTDPEATPASIAEALGDTEEAVRQSIDRIRGKTARAFATLAQSPFTAEVAAELDPALRRELLDLLQEE